MRRTTTQTADQVKTDVAKLGGIGSGHPYYDPTAFVAVRDVRFGTSGRNILRGPGHVQHEPEPLPGVCDSRPVPIAVSSRVLQLHQHGAFRRAVRERFIGQFPRDHERESGPAAIPARPSTRVLTRSTPCGRRTRRVARTRPARVANRPPHERASRASAAVVRRAFMPGPAVTASVAGRRAKQPGADPSVSATFTTDDVTTRSHAAAEILASPGLARTRCQNPSQPSRDGPVSP